MCSFVSFWGEKIPRETQPQMFCFVSLLGVKSLSETQPRGIELLYLTYFLFPFSIKLENRFKILILLFPGVVCWREGEEM